MERIVKAVKCLGVASGYLSHELGGFVNIQSRASIHLCHHPYLSRATKMRKQGKLGKELSFSAYWSAPTGVVTASGKITSPRNNVTCRRHNAIIFFLFLARSDNSMALRTKILIETLVFGAVSRGGKNAICGGNLSRLLLLLFFRLVFGR